MRFEDKPKRKFPIVLRYDADEEKIKREQKLLERESESRSTARKNFTSTQSRSSTEKNSDRTPKPMTVAKLKVVRTSELGAFLDAGTGNSSDDILLHKLQQTAEVNVGDEVNVFLYLDPKKRLTASMRVPKLQEGQISRVKVINTSNDGAFLDVGAERGIFMPFREMRGRLKIGDYVWAKLYTDKTGRLAMTMNVSDEMRRASKPAATDLKRGDMITGTIFNIIDAGAFLISDEKNILFIAKSEMTRELKFGEELTVRVTFIREDGKVDGSMRLQKENALIVDAENILKFMQANDGRISEKLSPDLIRQRFNISKAAFKRALGHLFKEEKIQRDGLDFKVAK